MKRDKQNSYRSKFAKTTHPCMDVPIAADEPPFLLPDMFMYASIISGLSPCKRQHLVFSLPTTDVPTMGDQLYSRRTSVLDRSTCVLVNSLGQ